MVAEDKSNEEYGFMATDIADNTTENIFSPGCPFRSTDKITLTAWPSKSKHLSASSSRVAMSGEQVPFVLYTEVHDATHPSRCPMKIFQQSSAGLTVYLS